MIGNDDIADDLSGIFWQEAPAPATASEREKINDKNKD